MSKSIVLDGRLINIKQAGVRVYFQNILYVLAHRPTTNVLWHIIVRKDVFFCLPVEIQKSLKLNKDIKITLAGDRNKLYSLFPKYYGLEDSDLRVFPDYFGRNIFCGRVAVIIHDLHFLARPTTFSFPRRWFRKSIFALYHLLKPQMFCISERTRAELEKYYPRLACSARVIGSGTAIDLVAMISCGLPKQPFLLSVGTLHEHKNFVRLIRSFVRYVESKGDHDVSLVICGKAGNATSAVTAAIEWAVSKNVDIRHVSGLQDGEVRYLYEAAIGVVLPSFYEGYGLPLAEAIVCNKPVACSDITSFRDIGENVPRYFNPLDETSILAAISAIVSGSIDVALKEKRESLQFLRVVEKIEDSVLVTT